ncbi:hypothetical protein BGZ50_004303 [Haplosporangium sp. Z 11]|nr:hypothetical protein BGZ50_004303 [Haplosporangium sp. Z 11]
MMFVRGLHSEEDLDLKMPFNYTQFGVVLMFDIVGFSELTSIASSKGDVVAEMLSSQIGVYFDIAIRIIEYHGGDVVKFLGDALLVVFQADPVREHLINDPISACAAPLDSSNSDDPSAVTRRNKVLVRKAVQCGIELLTRLTDYRIYLSEEEFLRKLSELPSDDSLSWGQGSGIGQSEDGNNGNIYAVNGNQNGNGNSQWNNKNSNTNYAYNAGTISSATGSISSNSYLSVPTLLPISNGNGNNGNGRNGNGPRRSSVPTNTVSPTSSLKFSSGNNLDQAGISGSLWKKEDTMTSYSRPGSTTSKSRTGTFLANARSLFTHSNSSNDRQGMSAEEMTEDSRDLQMHLAMSAGPISNIIIGDIGQDNGLDNLLIQTTGRLEYAICGEQMSSIDDALNMARAGELTITPAAWKFVNPEAYPMVEPRRHCFILKSNQSGMDNPLLRRIRNEKLLNTSMASNPHYYKYINKSAIHRLILYPDNTSPAQFRTVTILFVSLGDVKPWTPEGLAACQKAIYQIHKTTSEYEGFIQQFAVDDKGATVLCAFGLPYPRSHEREAVFAAKSAWVIRRRLLTEGIHGFKISLSTGVIFTSMIGNEFRRDPAIVGDTIVIAVRILKFDYATESIVCDDATKEACTSDHDGLCDFEHMGDEFVKGKIKPLTIWKLVHFGAKKQIRRPDDIMVDETIGYEPEREKVTQFIKSWEREPDRNTILVSGPRGSGKSMFYQQICHIADRNRYHVCSAASAEVEKNTEYYLCKFLLLGLFDVMKKKDIPYATQETRDLGIALDRDDKDHSINSQSSPQRYRSASISIAQSVSGSAITTMGTTIHPHQLSQGLQQHYSSISTPMAQSVTNSTVAITTTLSSVLMDMAVPESVAMTPTTAYGSYSPSPSPSGPSVRSSFMSNSPWDISSSPTIRHFDEQPSERSSTYITKLKELINVSLQKMGGSDGMMDILHDIIAALSCDNSAPTMDAHDDQMLADFITRMLNYASAYVKIIIMFEDVQWIDKKSLDIIQVIHERCPGVLIVIFSRPQRDYGGNTLHNITHHYKHLHISLEGLKRREIEFALLKAFEEKGVTKISPDVIELVQEKTKGNPKFVKSMVNMLKDFSHVNIVEGELMTTGQECKESPTYKNMDEMLVKQDRKKMILMQYDRMSPRFQEFLKIASCLGEQFSLAEVAAIRPLESMLGAPEPGRSFLTKISDEDTYKFLGIATDQLTNVQFSDNVVMNTLYKFSSESTAKDIYESIPYEERVSYHLFMGQFYETFLAPAQFSDLLPLINRHYLKTDNTEKKIKYLKAISAFDLKSNMLTDASKSLQELIQILDTVRGAISMVSQEDLADIYGMKGECLSKRMRIEEAEPALLDSLARYGVYWPKTHQQWRMTLFMEKTKFIFHYHGATTPGIMQQSCKPPKAKVDAKTQVILQRIIRVLGCLQNVYFWKTDFNAAMLSTLYTLNYSRRLGLPSSEQTVSLGRYGILHYLKGNKHTYIEYMEKARLANDVGETTEGMLPAMRAYMEYSEGHRDAAHQLLSDAINESKSFGVVSSLATFYRSVTVKCAYRMWEGSFNVHPEDSSLLRAMSAVAIQNGDSEGETLFAIPTLANLLLHDRLRDAESWVVLIERFIMPKARLMNLLVIHGMLSYYYAKMGNFSKAKIYGELWAERISEQGAATHPFPLMSCAFVVMSLYETLDRSAASAAGASTEPLCVRRAEQIIRLAIQCLSHDPLQAVSHAFIVLSEALRCFMLQRHHREGFLKLHRGWDRLKDSLEGINFVRAYFLSRLGMHTEYSHEKDEYYNLAYVLFRSMAMDASVWLTDPTPGWRPPEMHAPLP